MNSSLHAAYYADEAVQRQVRVVENTQLARATFRLRFACPEMARRMVPGQFLMVRLAHWDDPLIGRPLALYDTVFSARSAAELIDVVYWVKGKFTQRLAEYLPGQALDVWGPLGNGFAPQAVDHLIMVAGGIGQTPFLALAQEALGRRRYGIGGRQAGWAKRVTLCYGVRSADLVAGREDFSRAGVEVCLASDDGSIGHHGRVTELLEQVLQRQARDPSRAIMCCGPEAMMQATAVLAQRWGTDCQVSLETPMACGIGICFTCVAKVKDDTGRWDYRRTCVEGPVFDAARIEW